ncbi:uncharacterized protein VTP21DRAFT_9776 [Calcarisporiella thermophila]|uniref:uncharacterized protein n=1 Tax=Calcarisporiella thermophila TaxID=911321 RepID=UPI00374324D8
MHLLRSRSRYRQTAQPIPTVLSTTPTSSNPSWRWFQPFSAPSQQAKSNSQNLDSTSSADESSDKSDDDLEEDETDNVALPEEPLSQLNGLLVTYGLLPLTRTFTQNSRDKPWGRRMLRRLGGNLGRQRNGKKMKGKGERRYDFDVGPEPFPFGRGVFGIHLVASLEYAGVEVEGNRRIPVVVDACVKCLKQTKALNTQGIFRLSGSISRVAHLKTIYDDPTKAYGRIHDLSDEDPHNLAALLKHYISSLPTPLIPHEFYDMLAGLSTSEMPEEAKLMAIVLLGKLLPPAHLDLLGYLVEFFGEICALGEENKMTPQALAICFSPVLTPPPSAIPSSTSTQQGQSSYAVAARAQAEANKRLTPTWEFIIEHQVEISKGWKEHNSVPLQRNTPPRQKPLFSNQVCWESLLDQLLHALREVSISDIEGAGNDPLDDALLLLRDSTFRRPSSFASSSSISSAMSAGVGNGGKKEMRENLRKLEKAVQKRDLLIARLAFALREARRQAENPNPRVTVEVKSEESEGEITPKANRNTPSTTPSGPSSLAKKPTVVASSAPGPSDSFDEFLQRRGLERLRERTLPTLEREMRPMEDWRARVRSAAHSPTSSSASISTPTSSPDSGVPIAARATSIKQEITEPGEQIKSHSLDSTPPPKSSAAPSPASRKRTKESPAEGDGRRPPLPAALTPATFSASSSREGEEAAKTRIYQVFRERRQRRAQPLREKCSEWKE